MSITKHSEVLMIKTMAFQLEFKSLKDSTVERFNYKPIDNFFNLTLPYRTKLQQQATGTQELFWYIK